MILKQSEVNVSLANKLKEEDIIKGSSICKDAYTRQRLQLELIYMDCRDRDCYDSSIASVVPQGPTTSPIMIIDSEPNEYDSKTRTPMFGPGGRLFSLVLDKLSVDRKNLYITNIVKCPSKTEDACWNCYGKYLLREIDAVRPKYIITMGDLAAKVIHSVFRDIEINTVEEVRNGSMPITIGDEHALLFSTYSPNAILERNGSLFNKYKVDFWNDMKNAFSKINS